MSIDLDINEKKLNIILCYALNAVLVTDCINSICLVFGLPNIIVTSVRNFGYIVVLLYALFAVVKKCMPECIVMFIILGLCIIVSEMRIGSVQPDVIKTYIFVIIRVTPIFALSLYLTDIKGFIDAFKIYIAIALIYGFINAFFLDGISTNYMTFSYNMLLPALFSFYFFITERKPIYLAAFLALVFMILAMGARGPIVCCLAGCVFIYILMNDKLTAKTAMIMIIAVLLTILLVAFFHQILSFLSTVFPGARTLVLLMNSTTLVQFLTGRDELYKYTIELIDKNMLLGLGVFSGNVFLGQKLGYDTYAEGVYPHNIILDLWLQFGIIFGTVLLIFIIVFVTRNVNRMKKIDKNAAAMLLIFVARNISLLVTSSYVIEPSFWFMIGCCCITMKINNISFDRKVYEI